MANVTAREEMSGEQRPVERVRSIDGAVTSMEN
jgi:hypothetical protein